MIECKITDSIVPIYCDNIFKGTGFIYKSYLITAEHVVKEYVSFIDNSYDHRIKDAQIKKTIKKIEYKYNNSFHTLSPANSIWSRKTADSLLFSFIDEDLAIFKIPEQNDSLSLCKNSTIGESCAKLYGFHYYNDSNIILKNRELLLSDTLARYNIKQEKCFYGINQHNDEIIVDGYSGGPVLRGNEIVGMLVGHIPDSNTYHLMKSSYILQKIYKDE